VLRHGLRIRRRSTACNENVTGHLGNLVTEAMGDKGSGTRATISCHYNTVFAIPGHDCRSCTHFIEGIRSAFKHNTGVVVDYLEQRNGQVE
jgi:hypothetical protein